MSLTSRNQRLIAYKKLVGKSHTSSEKESPGEQFGSSIQLASSTVFGEEISVDNTQEITFILEQAEGSQYIGSPSIGTGENLPSGQIQTNSNHGFVLKLAEPVVVNGVTYGVDSYVHQNSRLQIVPESFGSQYKPKVYSSTNMDASSQMAQDGSQDWVLDCFAGTLFMQDIYDGVYPFRIKAYVYTGKYLDEVVEEAASSGGSADAVLTTNVNQTIDGIKTFSNEIVVDGNIKLGNIDGAYNIGLGQNIFSNIAYQATYNVAIGSYSMYELNEGKHNTAIGGYSGYHVNGHTHNTYLGYAAGFNTIGSYNTFIGDYAGSSPSQQTLSNTTIISNGNGNERLRIDSDGNVSIKDTTSYGHRLYVNGSISGSSIHGDGTNVVSVDADKLDGEHGSYYLDYANFTGAPPSPNDASITISAGDGLQTGGVFTTNQSENKTITLAVDPTVVRTTNISLYATTGVTAGIGLSGGGTVGPLSLNLDFSELTYKTTDIAGTTEFILQDNGTESRKATSEIKLSFFNNDLGWTSNAGTVTNIETNNGITGGPINGAGTIGLTGQALALHNLSTNGLIARTGAGTVEVRTLTEGVGIDVANGDGVSGNPTVTLNLSEVPNVTDPMVGTDKFIILDGSSQGQKAASDIGLSIFNNDEQFTTIEKIVNGEGLNATVDLVNQTKTLSVDDTVVRTTGDQTISGIKTFNQTIGGDITGNAGTATKLQNHRSITATGDVSWTVNFDGSENVIATATVADDSHNHIISNIDGLQDALDNKLPTTGKAADSDKLDGLDSTSFIRGDTNDTFTTLTGVNLDVSGELEGQFIGVGNNSSTSGYGISLYNGGVAGEPMYGIMFAGTSTFGTYGPVTSDWATYFTMNNGSGRGWIFRNKVNGVNVAAISNTGVAQFAGSVTASSFIGNITGNADTATKLQTARTITFAGDVGGNFTFDGYSNLTVNTAIGAGVIVDNDINASAAIADTKLATISTAGKVSNSATTATSANTANAIVARDANNNFSAGTITATLNGTATYASNASKHYVYNGSGIGNHLYVGLSYSYNNYHNQYAHTSLRYVPYDNLLYVPYIAINSSNKTVNGTTYNLHVNGTALFSGNVTTNGSFIGNLTGNADTATNLATARTITLSGDVVGNVSFNGSQNVDISTTLQNSVTAGTYRSVTVNSKGLIIAGTNPTSADDYGLTDVVRTTNVNQTIDGTKTFLNDIIVDNNIKVGNIAGSNNTGIGSNIMNSAAASSQNNVAIGSHSLYGLTTGEENTSVGALAGFHITTNTQNTCLGYVAGYNTVGNYNTFIGSYAGYPGNTQQNLNYTTVISNGNGYERLRIHSDGNVSIGYTANIGYKLDVNGTIRGSYFHGNGSSITNLDYNNITNKPTIANATITLSAGDGLSAGGNFTTNQATNETITLAVNDTVVRTTGNQTISGTKTFSSTSGATIILERDDAAITSGETLGSIYFDGTHAGNTSVGARIWAQADANWGTGNNGGTRLYFGVNDGGSGDASSTSHLMIDTSGIVSRSTYIGYWTGGSSYAGMYNSALSRSSTNYAIIQSNVGATFVNSAPGYDLNLRIGNATKLLVASDGKVGIGTTSPDELLEIYGASPFIKITNTDETEGGILFVDSAAESSQYGKIVFDSNTTSDNEIRFYVNNTTTSKMSLTKAGNLTVSGTITELSTRKVKKNIRSLGSQLDKIKKLNPVSYRRKEIEDSKKEMGFISEEVKEVYPELVNGEGVNYSKMVSILVSAVKELTEKVEQQEKQIKDLKRMVR